VSVTLDLQDCSFFGPALPEPFVRFELAAQLTRLGLLPTGHGWNFERDWSVLRRQLRSSGGQQSVCQHVVAPLAQRLGFDPPARQGEVATREGTEDGGWLMQAPCGARLRAWTFASDTDLDAPHRTGRAYRFSPMRSAQRVLLASSERLGLLTNGEELRLLLCDPARPDSHIAVPLAGTGGWRARNLAPDSYRLVLALATPKGIAVLRELLDAARLSQTRVTRDLRQQARSAIEGFLQAALDNPANSEESDLHLSADALWEEGLILAYRLLFILKLECAADPACAFSFASTSLWRETLSPNRALGPLVRRFLDHGHDTGHMLEDGLRFVFRVFRDGLSCSELSVTPLGGVLFGSQATPLLDRLNWGERAVALLLDRLLWTTPKGRARERVHYGALDVEDLGRVYEALLELEPGITDAPMSRLRRGKLEVVLPAARAAEYRGGNGSGSATRATWIEDIPKGRFFLRAGVGRKATGSYYTPHAFVRFLVRETLAPRIAEYSRDDDPNPAAILALKVIDPATGSGHFLVEACRYLAEALYAACRMCDESAAAAEDAAVCAASEDRARLLSRAVSLRRRLAELPDPDGLLLAYLPSRASEGGGSGFSQSRALAICRRLVAVHCLYGVDNNRLAVELGKLSLWLESYAEGLPLTFLDHRLVHGDSIAGPFVASLATLPVGGGILDPLLAHDVEVRLSEALHAALHEVDALQATVGADAADLALKAAAKLRLDAALRPLRLLAQAWSGAAMLATREMDDEWLALAHAVATTAAWPEALTDRQTAMLAAGSQALPWDLAFPEVFRPGGVGQGGFDAVLSNPPWDVMHPKSAEFLAGFDLAILDAARGQETRAIRNQMLSDFALANAWRDYQAAFTRQHRVVERLYQHQRFGAHGIVMGGKLDLYRVFAERMLRLVHSQGAIGIVVPSAFHANEGSTGIRRLYLHETRIEQCLSFENRNSLFDIHARFKFALIVARRPGPTMAVRCAFYLTEFAQIEEPARALDYDMEFIAESGGAYATLLELRGREDVEIAKRLIVGHERFGKWMDGAGIALSREIHMTDDADRFTPISRIQRSNRSDEPGQSGYLPLHEGKTIHQYSDRWDTPPRFAIRTVDLADKPQSVAGACFYRAACREVARSTDERTAIAAMLAPGVLCGHTISVERKPAGRPNAAALSLVGLMNSFPFDWLLRQKAAAHVSLYILAELPVPRLATDADRFLAHGALRLCCNHRGFAPLWREQLGDAWREATPRRSWPAISTEADRWLLRAAIDAIVAHAYGISRAQYERVLASFSHKSFASAPVLCITAFDELDSKGHAAFCRDHDPYSDIPVVVRPAQPVIRLADTADAQHSLLPARMARTGSARA
jgi:hypothetical protein